MAAESLWCVVPAAGRGARFGAAMPKQYVEIAGRPLLEWSLESLARSPRIAGIGKGREAAPEGRCCNRVGRVADGAG